MVTLVHSTADRRFVCVPTVPAKESDNIALISVRAMVFFVLVAACFISETLAAKAAGERPLSRVRPHVDFKLPLVLIFIRANRTCIRPADEVHRVMANARRL